MPTPVSLTSGVNSTSGTSVASASITPPTDKPVFIAVGYGTLNANFAVSGCGLTWTPVTDGTGNSEFGVSGRFVRLFKAFGTPITEALTISSPGVAQNMWAWSVFYYDVSQEDCVAQMVGGSGTGTSALVTLASFETGSAALGAIFRGSTDAITVGAGFTAIHSITVQDDDSRLLTEAQNAADTTVNASWTTSRVWGLIGVEIRTALGLIEGTHTEQNFRQGPICDTNGNLYVICEVPETDVDEPDMTMMKSTDGGNTWARVDFSNRPAQNDLESCVMVPSRTTTGLVHIVHQNSGDDVYYHNFRTSDHATNPDTWGTKDESVHVNVTPSEFQFVDLAVKSDDELCCVYMSDMVSSFSQAGFRTKPSGGSWSAQTRLDTTASAHFTWAGVCAGASDQLHFLYLDATNVHIYYRNLPDGGSLGSRVQVDDNAPSTDDLTPIPPVYARINNEEVVWTAWERASNSFLVGAAVVDGVAAAEETISDRTVLEDPASIASQQTVAALAFDESSGELHVVYADASTHDLWHNVRQPGSWGTDQWGTDTELVDAVEVDAIDVRIFERAGHRWLGIVYDDFTILNPSAGLQRYTALDLGATSAAVGKNVDLRWKVAQAAGKVLDIRWRTRGLVATNIDLRWRVSDAAGAALDLRWKVAGAVGRALDVRWRVKQGLGKALDLRWRTAALAGKALDLPWKVAQSIGHAVDVRWRVHAVIGRPLDLRWAVLVENVVGKALELRWKVHAAVGRSGDLRWRVLTRIGKTVELRWRVLQFVGRAVDLRWKIYAGVGRGLDLRWRVGALAARALDLRWKLYVAVARALDVRWRVEQTGATEVTPIELGGSYVPVVSLRGEASTTVELEGVS